ncbi:pyruvate:ferredoxin (flavodoxin) oxidoreductase [Streptococcus castoreus]|uniref:pyruvate:ferredoxin (flavodoxin) oxidoreductase n=1 Tax=Streptococcus castoreus TaxID=254786 RepID=UPI00041A9AF0|nr:pyruvate:ferredoxin (flavodoxin) oxidoreductase [Streptococcus castoreus]
MAHQAIMDGNTAAAHMAYAFSEVAGVYPITPSSTMGESVDIWQSQGRKNIFGQSLRVVEMQSEAGVAGFVHGSLKTGALTTTFTSSQGLLLMLPNMYKIAGELLPTVFHVAARSISTNALSIYGDHSDVMAVRQSGFVMLAESTVQEVMDLSAVAHLASLEISLPFLSFFDGFRTSHELQKINVLDDDDLKNLIAQDALETFRSRAMNPNHPTVSGTNQGPDTFFQQRETVNRHYQVTPYVVKKYMDKINQLQGTHYDVVNYYGHLQAEHILIAMGSVSQTIEQTVDYLNQSGRKVGFIQIYLYRPFPSERLLEVIPATVTSIAVLDRTKEPGSIGEPLLLDVQATFYESSLHPKIIGGRYGIGSKDTSPEQIVAVFDELLKVEPKKQFTVGIEDDVTHLSLTVGEKLDLTPSDTYQAKFWGMGGDGTVGTSKSIIKLLGDHTERNIQGYFYYDSRKQRGLTISQLRFGKETIKSSYSVQTTDFVAVSTPAYLRKYDLLKGLKKGGIFLLNTPDDVDDVCRKLPNDMKRYLAENHIQFYIIDAFQIAQEADIFPRTSLCLEVAFFEILQLLPASRQVLEAEMQTSYGLKSPEKMEKYLNAIHRSIGAVQKVLVAKEWGDLSDSKQILRRDLNQFSCQIQMPVNCLKGEHLAVGSLIDNGMAAGDMPLGLAPQEKRNIAWEIPIWDENHCVQCNRCSFVCPHAAIRPFLAEEDELQVAPEGYRVMDFKGKDGMYYRIQVSVENCTGCGLCVNACPKTGKALKMLPLNQLAQEEISQETVNWAFSQTLCIKENPAKSGTVAHTQFERPLLEFSGACAGCGETSYVKLLTQLFGDRMLIANATGCSSIWGGMIPTSPYSKNCHGQGPAWSNSLLEDAAEFGYGMVVSNEVRRKSLIPIMQEAKKIANVELSLLIEDWIAHMDEGCGSRARASKLSSLLNEVREEQSIFQELYDKRDLFVKPCQWIIGGDGWAYDIGYGGLDHVIASGADVNILVLDNEVYSNTGGHLSKGTPTSAITNFSVDGNRSAKKDLGMMAITYGNVYVAQVASGANPEQVIKAFEEAENYPGPSIVIAYVPCITHGLQGGMSQTLTEAREAVESGYWSLYRYNPLLVEQGKNPMLLDFKQPDFSQMVQFMLKQERFSDLRQANPTEVEKLFEQAVAQAKRRFEQYATLSGDLETINRHQEKKINRKQEFIAVDVEDGFQAILKDLEF